MANSGAPTPYPPLPNPENSLSVPITDANNGVYATASAPTVAGAPTGNSGPASAGGYQPAVTASVLSLILAELRVISALLNMNSLNADLSSLRADEIPGATGGVLN